MIKEKSEYGEKMLWERDFAEVARKDILRTKYHKRRPRLRSRSVKVYVASGCRNNPGQGSIGIVVKDTRNRELLRWQERIGDATNMVAEYKAISKGLEICQSKMQARRIKLYSCNLTVILQLKGKNKIKKGHLRKLYDEIKKLEGALQVVKYKYMQRTAKQIEQVKALVWRK